MLYWECKIYPKGETWEDTGRTVLLPFAEVSDNGAYARKELESITGPNWCIHDTKLVTLVKVD